MTTLRAPEEFNPYGTPVAEGSGRVTFTRDAISHAFHLDPGWWRGAEVGAEFAPYDTIAWVVIGSAGVDWLAVGVDTFGTVVHLYVEEDELVSPGQPLIEYEPRDPTFEDWENEWRRRMDRSRRVEELEALLGTPWRAFWASLTGSYRRGAIGDRADEP